MKKLLVTGMIVATLFTACKSKKGDAGKQEKEVSGTEKTTVKNDEMPSIDIASLKDEASFLKAWETFTDARIADEKKQKEVSGYEGHYVEYLDMYTAMLKATTAFSSAMTDPSASVAFSEKVSAIQDKMYAK